jgi:Rrf2 family protein
MKLSDAAALALHTVDYLARHPERLVSNQEVADNLGASANHLSKVHQWLVHANLVIAVRGPGGGFQLARDPAKITLLEVIEAVDGPLRPSQCLLGREKCIRETCLLGSLARNINQQVVDFFQNTTVAQLSTPIDAPIQVE